MATRQRLHQLQRAGESETPSSRTLRPPRIATRTPAPPRSADRTLAVAGYRTRRNLRGSNAGE